MVLETAPESLELSPVQALIDASAAEIMTSALADGTCGPDLEYDGEFLELSQAVAGKPETQFADAEPPDWRDVKRISESLFERTRDLRVATCWARAVLNLDGFKGLPLGLAVVQGLIEQRWPDVNPMPEDGDYYARSNTLALLSQTDGLLGDLRRCQVMADRSIGEVRVRDIEQALNKIPMAEGTTAPSPSALRAMLAAAAVRDDLLTAVAPYADAQVQAIGRALNEKLGIDAAPDLRPLRSMLASIAELMPQTSNNDGNASDESADEPGDDAIASGATRGGTQSKTLADGVHSREQALRAIDLVCDYLERTEPTNPAQLLLRRARRLINKNFLELMRELAPDALSEVARVMGVDPETLKAVEPAEE